MRLNPVLHQNKEMPLLEKDLTEKIIYAAIEVHKALGPGMLESVYQTCMAHESKLLKLNFEQQVPLMVIYKGIQLDGGYRLDFVFEKRVIVELKSVEEVLSVHEAQLITYLKLTNIHVGLLLNFNVPVLKDGIYRRVL
jgi:GxxExxY protein